ncbi:MAG: hypothetical protein WBX20_14005 [Terrimicrobiaceae bacterium]
MNTQFKTLFTVAIAHGYYSGNCEDIHFIVPGDAAQLLKNGRLLARELDGMFYVLFEADDSGAAWAPITGRTLRVGLQLANPFFSNFTADDASQGSSRRLYKNSSVPTALDAAMNVTLSGRVFSHALSDSQRPVTVTLKDSAGQTLRSESLLAAHNRSAVSFDLAGEAPGTYTIEEVYPTSTKQTVYYFDPELLQAGVFGVLEVKIHSAFYAAAAELQIAFDARQETLNYYVLANNYSESDLNLLSVTDAGFTDDGRPQIAFDRISSASFTAAEISPSLLGGNSAGVVLFRSQASVKRTQKARKKIQLKKNGEVLVAQLPQPGPEKANADLIIPISKP